MLELSRLVGEAFFGAYKDLRPIQQAAIPPILEGRDVLVRAATASGKTEAAIAPLVDRLLKSIREANGTTIVVVSPTRALVNDLYRRLEEPLSSVGVRLGIRHGERDQIARAEKPKVLLTTPESFDGLVGRREPSLESVRAIVLDEAHLLFNTQRGLQVGLTIRRLELWLKVEVQTIGLSATIGSANAVWKFFRPGRTVVDVTVAGARPLEYRIHLGVSIQDLVNTTRKFADKKLLIFVNSRKECELIGDRLIAAGSDPSRVFVHHSSLDSSERQHVEARFTDARAAVCLATPTLELGIDIGSIDLVVLYGMPANWQSLAQRVGRGNRRNDFIEALLCVPTKGSSSPTFLEQLTFQALLAEMFQHESSQVTAQELRGAFAQQLCSELDARGGFVGIKTLAAIGEPWPHLNSQVTADVLDTLVEAGVLQKHPAYNRYGADRGLHELRDRWQIWSNFAGSGQFIDVRTRDRHIGTIGVQNSKTLGVGDIFILGGRRWKVERIEPSGIAVTSTNAEPTRTVEQGGAKMNPSQTLADWARLVICDSKEAERVFPRVGGECLRDLVKPIRQLLKDGAIPLLRNDGKHHYLTFGGALINATLATRFGIPKLTDSVVLSTNDKADFRSIPDSIDDLVSGVTSSPSERSQFQNLLPEGMIVEEDRSILRSDPTLPIILHRLRSSPVVEVQSPNLLNVLGFTAG